MTAPDQTVIDADAHLGETATWLVDIDEQLARRCPGLALLVGTALFAGVDASDPPATPMWTELAAWARKSSMADAAALAERPELAHLFMPAPIDVRERIAWMDRVGITHQVCGPTVAAQVLIGAYGLDPALSSQITEAYHRWVAQEVANGAGRLHPTAWLDHSCVDAARRSLEEAAAGGAWTFVVPIDEGVWEKVVGDAWSEVWAAADSLGVMPSLHLGIVSSASGVVTAAGSWADTQLRAQRCAVRWASSVHADRHPDLRLLVQELGVDWADPWLRNLQRAEQTPLVSWLGRASARRRSLHEIASSQVVWVPLPRDPLDMVLETALRTRLAFGSDWPHPEGWGNDPVRAVSESISDPELCVRFLAGAAWRPHIS